MAHLAPRRDRGDVLGQLAQRHRLLVRLPIEVAVRHAFEHFPRHRHLMIELRQQRIDERHRYFVP
jgi:hypothetical protein